MSNIESDDIVAIVDEIMVEGGDDGFDTGIEEIKLAIDYPSPKEIENLLDEFHKYVGADSEVELPLIGKNDIVITHIEDELDNISAENELKIDQPIILEDPEPATDIEKMDPFIEIEQNQLPEIEEINPFIEQNQLLENEEIKQPIVVEEDSDDSLIEEPIIIGNSESLIDEKKRYEKLNKLTKQLDDIFDD